MNAEGADERGSLHEAFKIRSIRFHQQHPF
jgi:hypothetical protein